MFPSFDFFSYKKICEPRYSLPDIFIRLTKENNEKNKSQIYKFKSNKIFFFIYLVMYTHTKDNFLKLFQVSTGI